MFPTTRTGQSSTRYHNLSLTVTILQTIVWSSKCRNSKNSPDNNKGTISIWKEVRHQKIRPRKDFSKRKRITRSTMLRLTMRESSRTRIMSRLLIRNKIILTRGYRMWKGWNKKDWQTAGGPWIWLLRGIWPKATISNSLEGPISPTTWANAVRTAVCRKQRSQSTISPERNLSPPLQHQKARIKRPSQRTDSILSLYFHFINTPIIIFCIIFL